MRREFARLGAVHRGRHIAGPFGVDRFLVPRGTNLVRLELPLAQPSQLRVAPYTPAWPFADSGQVARIEKRQREPIAQLILGRGGDVSGALGTEFDLVSVTRASGAAYTLQLAALTKRHVITKPGVYRIQPVPLGPARDHAPITALIFSGPRARKRHDLSQSAAIELRRNSVLERQFNLSRTVEIFFRVVDSGRYEISGSGAAARHVVRPYGRPAKGKWSEREPDANATMDLAKGYYRLRIKPEEAGIHRLAIASLEASDRSQGELMSSTGTVEIVTVKPGHEAVIGIADAAEHVGLAVRGLPSRLRTPLPIVLDPGHTVSVPIVLSSSGQVRLENAADSNDFQLRVAGQLAPVDTQVLDLAAGTHLLSVASRALAPRQIALKFTPSESQAVNVSAAQSLVPSVPVGASVWLDLKSNEPQQLYLDIAEDGLYHLASSGLLATAARLHARLIPNLAAVSANGRGRNFKLLRYLRKGQYRAQIETVGRSAGATRVQLDVVPVTDGGGT